MNKRFTGKRESSLTDKLNEIEGDENEGENEDLNIGEDEYDMGGRQE